MYVDNPIAAYVHHIPLSGSVASEYRAGISASHRQPHVGCGQGILRIEVVVLVELRVISPEQLHTVHTVGSDEPCMGGGEVVVHLDAAGEGVGSLQDVQV